MAIPDFTLKPSFPIASVIEAAQRRAQIEQQNRTAGNETLIKGLQTFAQGVDSLSQRRRQMAQAVKMGAAMGMAPEEVQGLSPEQVVQVGTQKNKQYDFLKLMALSNPTIVKEDWFKAALAAQSPAAPQTQTLATPAPSITPQSAVTPSPAPVPAVSGGPLTPPTTGFNVAQSTSTRPIDLLPNLLSKPMSAATGAAAMKMMTANRQEPVVTRATAEAQGSVQHGTHILPDAAGPGGKADKEYDTLENQVISRIVGIRGDKSLARTEEQRDAAIQAYNTIATVKQEGRLPNQLEYYDIIGQMWKARTGQSPTDQAIRDLDAKTLKGDLGKAYQYFTGNAAPRTTENVMNAIQSFADTSGKQADKLHGGYMRSHLIRPKNMTSDDFDRIVKAHRGLTFEEGTAESRQTKQVSPLSADEQAFIKAYEAKNNIK